MSVSQPRNRTSEDTFGFVPPPLSPIKKANTNTRVNKQSNLSGNKRGNANAQQSWKSQKEDGGSVAFQASEDGESVPFDEVEFQVTV